MVYPTVFLIHSATLNSRRQNFTLGYDAGTAAFTAGKTLTGATSHATAIIVSTGNIASGSLSLHTITGTFLNDEAISDNGTVPGAAVVNGVIAEAFNPATGELMYTDINVVTACRFTPGSTAVRDGQVIVLSPSVVLPPTIITPVMGDTLVVTETGFTGTFTLSTVPKPIYEAAQKVISHWMCDIAKAGA